MKNKKGFTLVEMLAVIVIVSILGMLAIPNVTRNVELSRRKSFVAEARTIVSASRSNYASGGYDLVNGVDDTKKNKVIYSKEAINGILANKLGKSPFGSNYSDFGMIIHKVTDQYGATSYEYFVCLIDEDGNGFDYTNEKDLDVNTFDYNKKVNNCTGLPAESYQVAVNVYQGTVDEPLQTVYEEEDAVFNLTPNATLVDPIATVTCTNGQKGAIVNNVLTVSNVTASTTCDVTYAGTMTVLYNDGTLIINEKASNASSNAAKHGKVLQRYPGLSNSNSYEFYDSDAQIWKNEKSKISHVEMGSIVKPSRTSYWFFDLEYMTSANLKNIDTSTITDMNHMFYHAGSAENVDTFKIVGLDEWDTSKVTNMNFMFSHSGYNASTWDIGNISNWNVSKVKEMISTFESAGYSATNFVLDLSKWFRSDSNPVIKDMADLFYEAGYSAKTFSLGDLSNWDTSSVTDMFSLFRHAGYSADVFDLGNLNNWDLSNVERTVYMFCLAGSKATTWNIGDLSSWNMSSVKDMMGMFYWAGRNTKNWNIGDLSNWDVSNSKRMSQLFLGAGYNSLVFNIGNLDNWDLSNAEEMEAMFHSSGQNSNVFNIGDLSNWKFPKTTSLRMLFYNTGASANVFNIGDLGKWDVSNITNMECLFELAGKSATTWNIGNLSNWNTSKVTNMQGMFSASGYSVASFNIGDLSTKTVDGIKRWDTSNVTNMMGMFANAGENATTWSIGDLSNWDVSKVTTTNSMFFHAGRNATTWSIGDLSGWNTSNMTNMLQMFESAGENSTTWNSIGTLKIYAANTYRMFYYCKKANGMVNIYTNSEYNDTGHKDMFTMAAIANGTQIKVNYVSAVTNIDSIIGTKSEIGHVIKGQVLS